MSPDRAYLVFRRFLLAQTAETLAYWHRQHPGAALAPETLTGLCPRRFPVNRQGQTLLSLDEQLWQRGRVRYGVHR